MANILDIKRRIRSVTNTRQITKAMKMVSAAKLRRAQERALAARPYAQMLTNVLKSLVSRAEIYDPETGEPRHPLLAQREERNVLLIVVTGDKGLAGAFNTNILKAAMQFIGDEGREEHRDRNRRSQGARFPAPPFPVMAEPRTAESGEGIADHRHRRARSGVLNKVDHALATELAERVIERYAKCEIDSVYLLFQRVQVGDSAAAGGGTGSADRRDRRGGCAADARIDAERKGRSAMKAAISAGVGMRSTRTLARLTRPPRNSPPRRWTTSTSSLRPRCSTICLPKYVGIQIFHALLESVAAEHAARMTAMESATNNATDMIDSLTLAMNRARQAKITKEIIEIVSGAAAQ